MDNNLIEIGQLRKTHGVNGELNLFLFDKGSTSIKKGSSYLLKDNLGTTPFNLRSVEVESISYGHSCRIKFEKIDSLEGAKELVNMYVISKRKNLPPIKSDEFYLNDIIGFCVYGDDGHRLGKVEKFYSNNIQEVVCMDTGIEFPLVEDIVQRFDFDSKTLKLKVKGSFFEAI